MFIQILSNFKQQQLAFGKCECWIIMHSRHDGKVHHCRIRTRMINGEKKYYFLENKQLDTLYELISYYTKEKLKTPHFSTTLITPCPQPCPHLNMPSVTVLLFLFANQSDDSLKVWKNRQYTCKKLYETECLFLNFYDTLTTCFAVLDNFFSNITNGLFLDGLTRLLISSVQKNC